MLRRRLCSASEVVAGELRAFRLPGVTWPIIATRLDGQIVATPGVCPHEDVGLADGELAGDCVVCPGHGWHFDLRTGRCLHDGALELRRYKVTLVGDEVWIDLL